MKLSYTLLNTTIVPPRGFVGVLPCGKELRASHHSQLLRELSFHYPKETQEQLKQRVNDDTCAALEQLKAHSFMSAQYPSLEQQGDVTVIPNQLLLPAPHNYNPGLFSFGGKLVMCYRRHLPNAFSEIGITEIDSQTLLPAPTKQQFTLKIPKEFDNEDHEDARIFWHGDDIYVSYTMWRRATKNGKWLYMPRVDVAVFDSKWNFKHRFTPDYDGNGRGRSAQKNWTFFSHDGELMFVYDFAKHVVGHIQASGICNAVLTPGITWDYGIIRGSTPPQRISETEYLSFYHSRRKDAGVPYKNRYYAGAYCFEAREPFRITRYTERPVFAGSERNLQWSSELACVFPCGLVIDGETALVSMGSNDMECAIARVNVPELLETMIKP